MKMSSPKKSLGQNFLMHPQIADRIAHVADLAPNDVVFEIGPGRGMLTRALIARVKKVVALEADAELYAFLQEEFASEIKNKTLELIHSDIRTFDLAELPKKYKLVANIPYY